MKKWCEQAEETKNKLHEKELAGERLNYDTALKVFLSDYMCNRAYKEAEWVERNELYRGAVYPDTCSIELSDEDIKNWVNSMYHKLSNGAIIKGEHWDFDTSHRVGKESGVDFALVKPMYWYAVLNMMWHDRQATALMTKMESNPNYFIASAKEFLFDDDSKMSADERVETYYKDFY